MFAQLMTKQKIIRIPDLLNTFEDIQTEEKLTPMCFGKKYSIIVNSFTASFHQAQIVLQMSSQSSVSKFIYLIIIILSMSCSNC